MRVADKMSFDQVNRSVAKNRSQMNELQNQAATQKRVTKPSDDPVAASRVLFSRVEQRGTEQFIKNLNYARGFLDFTEQSLGELGEVVVRAKELAINQANDASANPQTRRIVAAEVAQLRNQAIQIGNRKLGDRFIFGGFKTTETPFNEQGSYSGDDGEMKIHIDKENFLSMNMPGSVVFEGKGLSKDGMTFTSPRQARTTEEFREQVGLENERASESRMPERYGRGPEMQSPRGQAETPMRGPASIRTTDTVAPARGQKVDPDEKFADVSRYEGDESLKSGGEGAIPQGTNLFDAFQKFEIALNTNDKAAIQDSIDRLEEAMQQVIMARTSLGSRVMTIDNVLNSMHSNMVDTKANISNLEDADAFEVISDINKTESALQATLQTSGKLIQKSLMDFVS